MKYLKDKYNISLLNINHKLYDRRMNPYHHMSTTVALGGVHDFYKNYTEIELDNNRKLSYYGIKDGEVFIIKYNNLEEVVDSIVHKLIVHMDYIYSMLTLRGATHFYSYIKEITEVFSTNLPNNSENIYQLDRLLLLLMYTDEDSHIASYVRTHFDALDKASGEYCDILFIENPSSIEPYMYWKNILEEKLYVIWKILGWADSVPYNKNDIYKIASRFGISFDQIPCAIHFDKVSLELKNIFHIDNDLTYSFRKIFSNFQSGRKTSVRLQETSSEVTQTSKSICFLSYNQRDKILVRKVASTLHSYGIETWFDEWEILPGDRITEKIDEGLSKANTVVFFLSSNSINSNWVTEEMYNSLHKSISSGSVQIIPVIISQCPIPSILSNYKSINIGDNPSKIAQEIRNAVARLSPKTFAKDEVSDK